MSPTPQTILAARKSAGLTQVRAAALIDAKPRTWQDWEGGRRNMPASKFVAFKFLSGQL